MTETRAILKAVSTVDSKLSNLPIEDGQLIFVYDKKKIVCLLYTSPSPRD